MNHPVPAIRGVSREVIASPRAATHKQAFKSMELRSLSNPILIGAFLLCGAALANEKPFRPARTIDGHVDLQGVWRNSNLTPLERSPAFRSLVISRAEAARIESRINDIFEDRTRPTEPTEYQDSRRVEKIRGEFHSSIIIDPEDGLIPGNALFKELIARTRMPAYDGPEQRPSDERCLTGPAGPPIQAYPVNSLHQIMQTRNAIVIHSEEKHQARIVRLNAEHAPASVTSWLGDSIGWWEYDTLVIETKYFAPTSTVRQTLWEVILVSPQTTIVERITRVSSNELHYVFTIEDPTYYTRPWTGETHLWLSSDRMFEAGCHEGNYSLFNILRGARVQEASKTKSK